MSFKRGSFINRYIFSIKNELKNMYKFEESHIGRFFYCAILYLQNTVIKNLFD